MNIQRKILPVFRDISFNPNEIEEYLPMDAYHPMIFDRFCEDGWCYWSNSMFRRNYWEWKDNPCRVVLLRIDLQQFTMSKSQRICLRRNCDLTIVQKHIHITDAHEKLFEKHAARFTHNRPQSIYGFFSYFSSIMPSYGVMLEVYNPEGNMIATSFFHAGINSIAGNYCIFDPEESARGLGLFTMLQELHIGKINNRRYYYPGFVYDLPSEFDYKLNFNATEYFDWWGNWYPLERLPIRDWRSEWEVGSPLNRTDTDQY